jgi:hypothetical protein
MENNHVYNLMTQFTEESRALWRIRKHYIEEAAGNDAEVAFWNKLAADKEAHLVELKALMASYMK